MTEASLRKYFVAPPQLATPRLLLRAMTRADAADMHDYAKREQVTRYLSWQPHATLEDTRAFLGSVRKRYRKGTLYDWAIVERTSGKMIGTCGFTAFDLKNQSAELGYVLHPAYWGRGMMPEAVRAVLAFAFETLSLHRVEARFLPANTQSRRVMEKVGMHFEGIARESFWRDGVYFDLGCCAILRSDFEAWEEVL